MDIDIDVALSLSLPKLPYPLHTNYDAALPSHDRSLAGSLPT